jgi:hypothetical protein
MKNVARRSLLTPWLLIVLLVVLALESSPVSAAEASGAAKAPRFKMTLREGKLTARIHTAPLRKVIEEISGLTGAEVRWLTQEEEEDPVSAEFTDLPLDEALENILKKNFTLSYTFVGNDKKLVGIWIASRSESRRTFEAMNSLSIMRDAPPENARERDTTGIKKDATANVGGNEWRAEPMPVDPASEINLAEAPPSVRLRAIELLATHAENDQEVRTILSHFADTDPDRQVREMASRVLEGMK